jgi:hypothetical protein
LLPDVTVTARIFGMDPTNVNVRSDVAAAPHDVRDVNVTLQFY